MVTFPHGFAGLDPWAHRALLTADQPKNNFSNNKKTNTITITIFVVNFATKHRLLILPRHIIEL